MLIYTDGSAKGNGKANNSGGFGVVIVSDDNQNLITQYSHFENNTTNNIQELKAILWAMINYGKYSPIVFSDSAYCVNTLTKWMYGWAANNWLKSDNKPPENLELIKAYYELEKKGYKINLQKVAGHSGNRWNEYADKLATGQIK